MLKAHARYKGRGRGASEAGSSMCDVWRLVGLVFMFFAINSMVRAVPTLLR